ncbi:pyridoxamine 5'-phosphate oxidase family protein [Pseudonocardia kujensis]|uniref:pyridoxamine 5'-phosphate oxidase family protein n=1 Tax=Pseudonocardia kujensis TaxID=1128675 RepID=UPI001E637663|nr:pyridoxamine 5'-phosphate oxidase family protein [Pseudonocardia kujensis]MCE0767441.1 pyridoxamine 5'-phosphate oxidase family protein [Pseudonocardia kujensis]
MSIPIHPEARKILESPVNAHFVTTRSNGRPHVSFVWFDLTPEGTITIGTPPWRVKTKNVLRNPYVVLSIMDDIKAANGLHRHLLVEGNATVDHDPVKAKRFMDDLALKYTGTWGLDLGEDDFCTINIDVTRITGHGPWHTGRTTSYGTPV